MQRLLLAAPLLEYSPAFNCQLEGPLGAQRCMRDSLVILCAGTCIHSKVRHLTAHLRGRRDAWLRACWHAAGWCCRPPTSLKRADDPGGAPCIEHVLPIRKDPTGGDRQRHDGSKTLLS